MSNLNTLKTLIDQSFTAVSAKGVSVSRVQRKNLPAKIAEISTGSPTLPDLVAGGTYKKTDGTPVVITPISGETTTIRLLVAATGPMRTALVLTFTGTVTIDWGDGTTTSPTSGVAAVHQYDGVNAIPCGRPWGVYLITITGGTVTAIASSSSRDDWGSRIGNIISYAVKSNSVTSLINLSFSSSSNVINYMLEDIYIRAPLTTLGFLLLYGYSAHRFDAVATGASAVPLNNWGISSASSIIRFDFSASKISGDVVISPLCANATSILFNQANIELGNINITWNSLSTAAFVALFNSLPTVVSKTIQIGSSAAALALTPEQITIATAKGWTVTIT